MRGYRVALAILFTAVPTFAQLPQKMRRALPLWPKGAPGSEARAAEAEEVGSNVCNVHNLSLTPYVLDPDILRGSRIACSGLIDRQHLRAAGRAAASRRTPPADAWLGVAREQARSGGEARPPVRCPLLPPSARERLPAITPRPRRRSAGRPSTAR